MFDSIALIVVYGTLAASLAFILFIGTIASNKHIAQCKAFYKTRKANKMEAERQARIARNPYGAYLLQQKAKNKNA